MATFKFIEPSAAVITQMQNDFNDADSLAQGAEEKITAATHAICLMLREPDSGHMRLRIKTLCDLIQFHSFDVMNTLNSISEKYGANHIDEHTRAEESLIYAAVRGETVNG